jgi:hypothetical protein
MKGDRTASIRSAALQTESGVNGFFRSGSHDGREDIRRKMICFCLNGHSTINEANLVKSFRKFRWRHLFIVSITTQPPSSSAAAIIGRGLLQHHARRRGCPHQYRRCPLKSVSQTGSSECGAKEVRDLVSGAPLGNVRGLLLDEVDLIAEHDDLRGCLRVVHAVDPTLDVIEWSIVGNRIDDESERGSAIEQRPDRLVLLLTGSVPDVERDLAIRDADRVRDEIRPHCRHHLWAEAIEAVSVDNTRLPHRGVHAEDNFEGVFRIHLITSANA